MTIMHACMAYKNNDTVGFVHTQASTIRGHPGPSDASFTITYPQDSYPMVSDVPSVKYKVIFLIR